ncbi:MAG: hypothetical protein ACLU62_10215 [Hydrogeniiclostridium sp.]|mgnify:FL=1
MSTKTISVENVRRVRPALRKLAALFLAGILALGLSSCDSTDKTWAMKRGDTTIPIGCYIYNFYVTTLNAPYQEGVDSSKSMLEQEIEGKPAETWIRENAVRSTKLMLAVDDMMNELGLSLSEEDQKQIETNTNSGWTQLSSALEKYVAKSSYQQAYTELNYKYTMVFKALYGEGGEKEVPEGELLQYVKEHYTDYSYIMAPLYDSSYQTLEDEKKTAVRDLLEDCVKKINDGSMTVEEAAEAYEKEMETSDSLTSGVTDLEAQGGNDKLVDALKKIDAGKAYFVDLSEESSCYFLVYKRDINKTAGEYLDNEDNRLSVLSELKGDEFADMMEEKVDTMTGVEINDAALNEYTASMYYTFKEPASSAPSSSSSDSSSASSVASSSSEASSEESSSGSSEGASSEE